MTGGSTHPADEEPSFGDPTRRTYFAEERTLLAWWRSGIAAMAVALGVGRILPAITKGAEWPYLLLGVGYALVAALFVAVGTVRQRQVDRALSAGRFVPLAPRMVALLTGLLLLLTLSTAIVVILGA